MSVASTNPFAILGEETSRPSSPAPTSKQKEASAPQPTRGAAKSKGPASRGGRYYSRGGKTQRDSNQDNPEDAPVGDESAKKRVDGEGRGRGRGRGRGGDRGGRGRGRPFDKHSATGKTDSDKKIHQAWGGGEGGTELKAEEAGTTDAQAEGAATDDWTAAPADSWAAPPAASDPWAAPASTDDWGAAPAEGDSTPATQGEKDGDDRKLREREPEDEDNTISYDQYIAQMKGTTTSVVPKLEGIREANEGAEATWGDVFEHKKGEDEDAYFVGKTKHATKARAGAEKKEKVYIEIDARFDRPSRGGRGRGGDRGGDRGRGRGRGGARGSRPNGPSATVNVDDETAFPSLS